jgi:mRNA-degrading endonuclease toxin of MazEF toxin-antitoxin module
VSIITVDGTNTLVIDIPAQSFFRNGDRGCLIITQNLPEAATLYMPVAISVGGVTTTVYEVTTCDCSPVTAPMLRTRRRYPFKVSANATTGTFKILKNLSCAANNVSATIPVATGG